MTDLDHRQVIAIDGPGAAGKSTVARRLADQLGAMLFDTGALYRTVTLAALRQDIAPSDEQALAELAGGLSITFQPASVADGRTADVLLDDEDVTWAIRTPEIDSSVSPVSAHPAVREQLLDVQRNIANGARVVIVGRDIGTVVTPDAGIKIYLDASTEERARRRLVDLHERGIDATFDSVLADLKARDAFDSGRATAPLRPAQDAVIIGSDGRTIDEIVTEIDSIVRARWESEGIPHG
ncbi:MAG TPA: (d)CMP kinase [Thermomicrobiales bacterium]|nr:(d)CMP kinase [Thermomicrobiales bacterium]